MHLPIHKKQKGVIPAGLRAGLNFRSIFFLIYLLDLNCPPAAYSLLASELKESLK